MAREQDEIARWKIKNAKKSNEQLNWVGRPRQGFILQRNDIFFLLFHSVIIGLTFYIIIVNRFKAEFPWFYIIAGLLGLIAFYQLFGRFLWSLLIRRKTYYGLTESQAFIVNEFPAYSISIHDLKTLHYLSKHDRKRSGDVMFGPDDQQISFKIRLQERWNDDGRQPPKPPGFYDIVNFALVFDLITQSRKKLGAPK